MNLKTIKFKTYYSRSFVCLLGAWYLSSQFANRAMENRNKVGKNNYYFFFFHKNFVLTKCNLYFMMMKMRWWANGYMAKIKNKKTKQKEKKIENKNCILFVLTLTIQVNDDVIVGKSFYSRLALTLHRSSFVFRNSI